MALMRGDHPFLLASLGLIAVIATATGWDTFVSYRAHRQLVERQMATLSSAAASQVEASMRAIDLLLEDAAKSIDLGRWPDVETETWLRARLASFPEVRNLIVVDPSGLMVGPNLSRLSSQSQGADLSDREYFVYQREHWRERNLYVSSPVVSRIHSQPSLPLARPLMPRNGGFGGVVVVGLDPAYFDGVLKAVAADEGMAGTLLRRDGIILSRYPDGDTFRGRSVADGSVLREHIPRSPNGVVEVLSPLDNQNRVIGYTSLAGYPLVMLVVKPLQAAFGNWRQRALHGAVTVLVLSATVLLLAALLERRERQRRAAVAEAERASRAKTDLLANVSHELRTPLNAVIGFSDLMLSNLSGETYPPRWREYLNDIHTSGQHLLDLINEILDVSAIEAGKLDLREERIDLSELLETCARLVSPGAAQNAVAMVSAVPRLPPLYADERRMKEIVLNLLSNSVKFTPQGGRVSLTAQVDASNGILITVADTGIGMDANGVAKALQPFGQVDSRLQRKFEGTGLGLPLTNGLVKLHGGELIIDSTPNVGTTISVHLPASRVLMDERCGNEGGRVTLAQSAGRDHRQR